jgi:hypothetical protein
MMYVVEMTSNGMTYILGFMMIFPAFEVTSQLLPQQILEATVSVLLMRGRNELRRCDELREPNIYT